MPAGVFARGQVEDDGDMALDVLDNNSLCMKVDDGDGLVEQQGLVDVVRRWGIIVRDVLLVINGLDGISGGTLLLGARESLMNAHDNGVAL